MLDQRLRELPASDAAAYSPKTGGSSAVTLRCAGCGGSVELAFWQPIARCPHCARVAYPDRSLRNLLPLGWDCPECGHANEGLSNFCLHCGAGLASRCLRCEAPVTGSICLRCGEHQAQLRHLQKRLALRAEWVPIQRERVQAQLEFVAEAAKAQAVPSAEPMPVRGDDRANRRSKRARGRSRRRGGWGFGWGWWPLALGVYFLIQQLGKWRSPVDQAQSAPLAWTAEWSNPIQNWWASFLPTLDRLQTLTPQDTEYGYLFAAGLVGLSAIPLGLYLIDKTAKRLFP